MMSMYSKKFENPSFLNTNPNSMSSMNTNGVNIVSRRTIISIILSNAVLLSHRALRVVASSVPVVVVVVVAAFLDTHVVFVEVVFGARGGIVVHQFGHLL
jgi:uncharacterized membrane protein YGL010W